MKRLLVFFCCACSVLRAQEALTLETIAAEPKIWPVEVMVTVDHKLPVIIDGKVRKTLKIDPGTMYKVKSISAAGVTVYALGGPRIFKAIETDVIARAEQNQARLTAPAELPLSPALNGPTSLSSPAPLLKSPPDAGGPLVADTALPSPVPGTLAAKLQGQLVTLIGGRLEPFDAARLGGKKYLAVYFSASWCGPCRDFTPSLVDWYEKRRADRDKFDIIFVSSDQDEKSMAGYMVEDGMPWPAVNFSKARSNIFSKYSGRGIPNLVILNEYGVILSRSFDGENYLGPAKPLKDLDRLLSTN